MQTSKDRVAPITGANKGIGFGIDRQLGQGGNRILIGVRNLRVIPTLVLIFVASSPTTHRAGILASGPPFEAADLSPTHRPFNPVLPEAELST
jgi:NAD(P)-dependent dehydrogenase (short-subunit alcohol dehydrogenase family)